MSIKTRRATYTRGETLSGIFTQSWRRELQFPIGSSIVTIMRFTWIVCLVCILAQTYSTSAEQGFHGKDVTNYLWALTGYWESTCNGQHVHIHSSFNKHVYVSDVPSVLDMSDTMDVYSLYIWTHESAKGGLLTLCSSEGCNSTAVIPGKATCYSTEESFVNATLSL